MLLPNPDVNIWLYNHSSLQHGRLCEDDQWRQIVNIEDAMALGCGSYIEIEELKQEMTREYFNQMFMCKFE